MKPSNNDKRQGRSNWQQSIDDAHNQCRAALKYAMVDVSSPERALWPAVSRSEMTQEHQAIARLHAVVLDYVEHLEPYQNRCADLWTERIMPPYELPDGRTLPIVLSEIEEWSDVLVEETEIVVGELNPRKRTTTVKCVYLPRKHARETFRQANRCIERLKLGAAPPTPERTVDGPEDAW